jgi:hypothetical protein
LPGFTLKEIFVFFWRARHLISPRAEREKSENHCTLLIFACTGQAEAKGERKVIGSLRRAEQAAERSAHGEGT